MKELCIKMKKFKTWGIRSFGIKEKMKKSILSCKLWDDILIQSQKSNVQHSILTLDSTYGIQMPPLTAVNVLLMQRQHLATRALRVLPRAEAPHHVNEKHQSRTKLLYIWSSFISRCKEKCKFFAYVWAIAILDSFSRTSMLSMHMPNLSWSKLWTNQFPMSVPFWGSLDSVWHQAHKKTNDKANPNTRSSHMWDYQHQKIMSTYTTVWNKGST